MIFAGTAVLTKREQKQRDRSWGRLVVYFFAAFLGEALLAPFAFFALSDFTLWHLRSLSNLQLDRGLPFLSRQGLPGDLSFFGDFPQAFFLVCFGVCFFAPVGIFVYTLFFFAISWQIA
jgi:hypothetical protein